MALFGSSDSAESSRRKGVKKAPGGDDGIDWAALGKQTGLSDAVAAAVDALSAAAGGQAGSPPKKGKGKARSSMGSAGERSQDGGVPALLNILRSLSCTFLALSPGAQRNTLWALLAFSVLYVPGLWTVKVALLAGLLLFKPLQLGHHGRGGDGHRGGLAKKQKQRDAKGHWFSDDPLVAALQRIPETITFANVGSPDPSSSSAAAPVAPWSPPMFPSPEAPPSPPMAQQRRPHAMPPPPLPPSVILPESAFFTPMLPPSSPPPPPARHQMPSSRSESQQLNLAGIGTPRLPSHLQHPAGRHPLQAIVGDRQVGPAVAQSTHKTPAAAATTLRMRHVTSPHATSHNSASHQPRSQFRLPSLPPSLPPPDDPHHPRSSSPSLGASCDNPWEKRPSGSFHRIAVAKKAWKRAFSSPSKEGQRPDLPASLMPGMPVSDAAERYERAKGVGVFDDDDEEGEWVDEYGRRIVAT